MLASAAFLAFSWQLAQGSRLAFEVDDEDGEDIKSEPHHFQRQLCPVLAYSLNQ